MVIGEVGSTEYGGSKATWIQEMLAELPTAYPKVHGLVWFNREAEGEPMDWSIETSSSAESAFAAGIQNPAYAGSQFASLSSAGRDSARRLTAARKQARRLSRALIQTSRCLAGH